MSNDSENLAFSLLAKHFKVPQILVRMFNPSYEAVYKTAGVTNIARTTDLMIDQLMVNIESPELRKVISLGNVDICIVKLPPKALCHGLSIAELVNQKGFPLELTITAIFSEEKQVFIVPKGSTQVFCNDRVFLCGSLKDIKAAAKVIQKQ